MKAHTKEFKENIAKFGRELDSKITYTQNGETIELGTEQLNSITPHYEGAILKSVMKQLDIDSNVEIPVGTEINYQFGVKVGNSYEYIDYGNYIVKEVEKQEDTRSYNITCYDKLLYSMQEYKMPIGKNIFNINNDYANFHTTISINGNQMTQTNAGTYARSEWKIEGLKVGDTYTLSYSFTNASGCSIQPRIMDSQNATAYKNGTVTTATSGYATLTFIAQTTTHWIRFYSNTTNTSDTNAVIYKNIQLEKGNQATTYEKYFAYPTTIKDYLKAICYDLGIPYQDSNFANYDKVIQSELYLDSNGKSLGYTYRDVLDEIAQATAGTICMNASDKLEVRYINETIGKNLLKTESRTYISNGITVSISNGEITLNGTATANTFLNIYTTNQINWINGQKYVLSAFNSTLNSNVRIRLNSSGSSDVILNLANKTAQINYSEDLELFTDKIQIRVQNGTTLTNYKLKPMIEEGEIAHQYEPYGDTIDEEYLKDVNVDFGEKYGAINTIVLSRSADSDSIYYPTTLPENPIELKISDNQIMNGNDRDTYLPAIYDKLNGLEYYINDYSSTGICYLDLCDKYNVKIGDKFYNCIMFNDDANITQGLEENIYAPMPEESVTEYTKADTTDRKINGAYIIANKASAEIEEITSRVDENEARVNAVETRQTATERTIEIKTKNIDDNGNITEVTTTNGYKFSADGLDIYNSDNSYHTLIDEDSTEYKDGSTTISITAKDGAGLRNLRTLEQHYYSFNNNNPQDILDTDNYDFVDERVEDDGEYVYATFYNGGDL